MFRPWIAPRIDETGSVVLTVALVEVDENCNILLDEPGQMRMVHKQEVRFVHTAMNSNKGMIAGFGFSDGLADLPVFFANPAGIRDFVVASKVQEMNMLGQQAKLLSQRKIASK